MSFAATFILVIILIIRPQEIWTFLEAFRLLDVFTFLAAVGVAIEFALGSRKNPYSPQIPFLGAFVFIAYFSSLIVLGRDGFALATSHATIPAVFMLVVMFGARTLPRLRTLMALLVALALFVTAVAIHQGHQPAQCIELDPDSSDWAAGEPDGRSCEFARDCRKGGHPESDYECEKLGLFKTVTVHQRVTWRGQLADPNELSVYLGATIPLLLMLAAATKKKWVTGLAIAIIGLDLYCVILSQSRGGQLVIGTVFGAYFISRYRWKGIFGGLLALPVILLGGRSGADAESSTDERTEILYEGINFVKQHPVFGMGIDGFKEEFHHTAHNAYLLAATELGLPGFMIWTGLLWASIKIPISVVRRPPQNIDPAVRALAVALLVSFLGMGVGIFFLSFTFKQLLFLWLGMCGALYSLVRENDPDFEVGINFTDLFGVAVFDAFILSFIYAFTRLKAGGG